MNELGSFIKLWERDSTCCLRLEDEGHLDAAVSHWLDTGRDSLLHLTLISGDSYRLLASQVLSWRVSTPEGRRNDEQIKRLQDEENARLQAELGWRDSD